MTMRFKLIANPAAGRNAKAQIRQAMQMLTAAGAAVSLDLTRGQGDAVKLAADIPTAEFDRIIVAGGDGTINEVINGLASPTLPLAILPIGTTNVFAIETGLPQLLQDACDLALNGMPTPIRVGRAGQRRFLLMAGIGFDAAVVQQVNPKVKRAIGKGAYLLSAFNTLIGYTDSLLQITDENGRHYSGYSLIISNASCYGGAFRLTPNASIFHDCFEVCLLRCSGRQTLLRAGLALLTGRPLAPPRAEIFTCRSLKVSGAGVPVQLDGDYFGTLPLDFSIDPDRLQIVLPTCRQ